MNWLRRYWQANPKSFLLVLLGIFGLIFVLTVCSLTLVSPRIVSSTPTFGEEQASLADPIKITFSFPVARRLAEPTISPKVEGTWSWQEGWLNNRLRRILVFTPDEFLEPETRYTVTVSGVTSVASLRATQSHSLVFTTQQIPEISSVSVSGVKDVKPGEPIKVALSAPNTGVVDYTFRLEPAAEVSVTLSEDQKEYVITPVAPLSQATDYQLVAERQLVALSRSNNEAVRRSEKETVLSDAFRTREPAKIEAFTPQGTSVLPTQEYILVRFREPMVRSDVERLSTLSPSLPGTWQWQNDQEVRYVFSSPLPLATTYTFTLQANATSQLGSYTDSPATFTFASVGNAKIISTSPRHGLSGASRTGQITINFDQPIVESSLRSRFSIEPKIDGSLSVSGSTATFKPANELAYYQTYKVNIASGVEAVYGRPLASTYSFSFRTQERVVILPIAYDRQDKALSCEVASLKMALAYKGVRVSEGDLMAIVGYDPTVKSGSTWGDPDQAFVGDINGAQNSTGYGVHWDPIARAAQAWRPAKAFRGWSVNDLAREIENGNPVVLWGVMGSAYPDPWYTPAGKRIDAWKGEHVRTLIGYKGSVDNPTTFIINDPIHGRLTWSTATLKSNWATFGNSGVVVY